VIPLVILKCHQEPIQKKGHITDEATLLSEVVNCKYGKEKEKPLPRDYILSPDNR
jgi:hypothetical protein